MGTTEPLKVAGRALVRPAGDLTLERFQWLQGQLSFAGVNLTVARLKQGDTVPVEQLAAQIMEAGRGPKVIAGALEVEGEPWSIVSAHRLAIELGSLTDPTAFASLTAVLYQVVLDFFVSGNGSSETSPSSSMTPEPSTAPESGESPSPGATAAPMTSESSPT